MPGDARKNLELEECPNCKATRWEHSNEQWAYCWCRIKLNHYTELVEALAKMTKWAKGMDGDSLPSPEMLAEADAVLAKVRECQ